MVTTVGVVVLIVGLICALVGLSYIVWTFCHFEAIYGL
jgi:hypothetical protein